MRRALVIAAVVAAAAGALALGGDDGERQRYRIVFDSAFGLVEGADFQIAGVPAGRIERFDLSEGWPPRAVVEAVVDDPGRPRLRADARCEVKPQSLIGEYFVDCDPGRSRRPLPHGTVPVERTANTIPLDLVNDVLRRPQQERLPLILNALGAGLAGRPEDVQEVLARAHPGLREANETLRILARQDRTIERFIADAEAVIGALAQRRRDVVRFVDEAEDAARAAAARRDELERTADRLPDLLAELEPAMASLGEVADAQLPVLGNLSRAASGLDATLARLQPFAERARPALLSLGELSRTGRAALERSQDEIDELRELAEQAPDLADPLRKLIQSLDDRDRAIEHDVRAEETAPPEPDPTADAKGKGFTGFESLLNYFYWQALSINLFDDVGHLLRVGLVVDECSPYSANPIKENRMHCVSWMGPYQPGVTAPDPTEGGTARASREGRGRDADGRDGAERGAGRDDAAGDDDAQAPAADGGPVGGDGEPEPYDPTEPPSLSLPDGLGRLLERVGGLLGGRAPDTNRSRPPTGLLDYLLGP